MSLRLLKKQFGEETGVSDAAKSVVQPSKPSKGRGRERPEADDGPRVMAPKVSGGFHGSSVQAAHVAATKKATVEAARSQEEWKNASEVAVKSGLGLKAVEEKKQKEEDERQAKREAARAKRKGEVAQREVDDLKSIEECEDQAWRDSDANDRVKYEAALIVRIAIRFGSSGVWTKIAEARSRGAEIPLDTKKVYLLAHPDKCPLPEAVDATAILNAQRPPEMTGSHTAIGGTVGAVGSKAAVAARVAARLATEAGSEVHKIDPEDDQICSFTQLVQKYSGVYTEEELQTYWETECVPLQSNKDSAPDQRQMKEPAPAVVDPEEDTLQKVDPEDGQLCTFRELQAKYSGTYSLLELQEYWNVECSAPAKPRRPKASVPKNPPAATASPPKKIEEQKAQPAAPAPAAVDAEDSFQKVDPEDGQLCTFKRLQEKYAGKYSVEELEEYWDVECSAVSKAQGCEASLPKKCAALAAHREPVTSRAPPSPDISEVEVQEAVPGLSAWLQCMNLGSYLAAASQWAEEQGAVGLDELVESLDELAVDLKMKPLEVKRMKAEAEVAASAATSRVSGTSAPPRNPPPSAGCAATPSRSSGPEAPRCVEPPAGPATSAVSYYNKSPTAPTPAVAQRRAQPAADPVVSASGGYPSQGAPTAKSSGPGSAATVGSSAPAAAPDERRIDPETGKPVTLSDLFSIYGRKYSMQEIDEYWESCEQADTGTAREQQGRSKETRSVRELLKRPGSMRY